MRASVSKSYDSYLNDLGSEIGNIGKLYENKEKLSRALVGLSNYAIRDLQVNSEVAIVDQKTFQKINPDPKAFMCQYGQKFYICPEKIRNVKQLVQTRCPSNEYSDIGLTILCAISIPHEITHVQQNIDCINFKQSFQTYLNSMSQLLFATGGFDKYTELAYEGEAYRNGVHYFLKKHQSGEVGPLISKEYERLLGFNSQLARQMMGQIVIGSACKMPYSRDPKGNIVNILTYGNDFIANKLDPKYFKDACRQYPSILIGINEKKQEKTPEELMEQYFSQSVNIGGKKERINDLNFLLDAYIFLLLPKLTTRKYKELCGRYGTENMNRFLDNMSKRIEKMSERSEIGYRDAFNRIDYAEKSNILDFDKEYLVRKHNRTTRDLNTYLKMCKSRDFDVNQVSGH